uniref:Uncharacterized protein n=1 Tax=Oryza meridionalis TaxID=40149 RepID=A0A0E0C9J2_9ORYZ
MSVEAKPGEVATLRDWPAGGTGAVYPRVGRGATLNLIKGKPHVVLGAETGSPGENASGKWQQA